MTAERSRPWDSAAQTEVRRSKYKIRRRLVIFSDRRPNKGVAEKYFPAAQFSRRYVIRKGGRSAVRGGSESVKMSRHRSNILPGWPGWRYPWRFNRQARLNPLSFRPSLLKCLESPPHYLIKRGNSCLAQVLSCPRKLSINKRFSTEVIRYISYSYSVCDTVHSRFLARYIGHKYHANLWYGE